MALNNEDWIEYNNGWRTCQFFSLAPGRLFVLFDINVAFLSSPDHHTGRALGKTFDWRILHGNRSILHSSPKSSLKYLPAHFGSDRNLSLRLTG
jgi:hypothetical protein